MPRKPDVTPEQEGVLKEVQEEYFSPTPPALCGHINRQHINAQGLREDLACALPAGHDGDHSAPYACLRPRDGSIVQAEAIANGKKVLQLSGVQVRDKYIPHEYVEVIETAYWSNAAGIPAAQVQPDAEQLAHIRATKGNMLDEAQIRRNASLQ